MKRMLINATQPEELRVAIVDGQTLYDLDIEVPGHGQKKDNVYKGRVSRVEPSLEACFVEYGADRHGFLPLREIAPSYHHDEAEPGKKLSIKDTISEGQEVIIQVTKEERGTKGAALTTYVSLAGRYLVLMPNNPGAGGVSGKISGADRDDTRAALAELDIPRGAGVIVRTAGGGRNKEQLQWDLDYLKSIWEAVCHAADERPAPFLVYQESNVIIRALRDHFAKDIGEIIIDDRDVLKEAQGFVEMVMPQHLAKLKFHEDRLPLFTRFQIESQIDAAYQRQVRLPSGGSLVLDQTEALVAVDINSARATQGSDINETAYNTNLEAAGEIARQLRLRDIGGLIVVDFIDMNTSRNLREVENGLRQALALDRARIQIGRISRFGLLEMSRQRLRPALSEAVFEPCPRCKGKGVIRSVGSLAISVLRQIEEESLKERTARVIAELPVPVATYLMNEKRSDLGDMESRMGAHIIIIPNPYMETPDYKVERTRSDQLSANEQATHEWVDEPDTPPMHKKPTRNEQPAVSALRPATPPPVDTSKRKKGGSGWLARLVGKLGTPEEKTGRQQSTGKTPERQGREHRNRRGSGRRNNNSRNRQQRPASGGGNKKPGSSRRGANRSNGNSGKKPNAGNKQSKPRSNARGGRKATASDGRNAPGKKSTESSKSDASTTNRDNNSAPGKTEAGNRSRTRRGKRGGRRRRGPGSRSGGNNTNRTNAPARPGGQSRSNKPEESSGNKTDNPKRDTVNPQGKQSDKSTAPKNGNAADKHMSSTPRAEDTPQLAALFEQKKNSDSRD